MIFIWKAICLTHFRYTDEFCILLHTHSNIFQLYGDTVRNLSNIRNHICTHLRMFYSCILHYNLIDYINIKIWNQFKIFKKLDNIDIYRYLFDKGHWTLELTCYFMSVWPQPKAYTTKSVRNHTQTSNVMTILLSCCNQQSCLHACKYINVFMNFK